MCQGDFEVAKSMVHDDEEKKLLDHIKRDRSTSLHIREDWDLLHPRKQPRAVSEGRGK